MPGPKVWILERCPGVLPGLAGVRAPVPSASATAQKAGAEAEHWGLAPALQSQKQAS